MKSEKEVKEVKKKHNHKNGRLILVLVLGAIITFTLSSLGYGELLGGVSRLLAVFGVFGIIALHYHGAYIAKKYGSGLKNGMLSNMLMWMVKPWELFVVGAVVSFYLERGAPIWNTVIALIGLSAFVASYKIGLFFEMLKETSTKEQPQN